MASPHTTFHSTQDFVEHANKVILMPGECLSPYDVTALFTSVSVGPALGITKDLLEKDSTLKERTVLPVKDIILLQEFCLRNTYISFQGQFYEQTEGTAMRCPVSSIVANLYMEYFEQKALSTDTHCPPKYGSGMWMTLGLSKGKKINKTSFNTLIVLTWPLSLQWKTTRRMGPYPSWIPLSNQRLMVNYLSLYKESLPTQSKTYSGIVITITFQLSIV